MPPPVHESDRVRELGPHAHTCDRAAGFRLQNLQSEQVEERHAPGVREQLFWKRGRVRTSHGTLAE